MFGPFQPLRWWTQRTMARLQMHPTCSSTIWTGSEDTCKHMNEENKKDIIHFLQCATHNLSHLISEPSCLRAAPVLLSPFYLLYSSLDMAGAGPFKPCMFGMKYMQMRPHVLHELPRPRSAHSWATCQVPTTLPLVCQIC